jgi:creatinine amidohydrolase
MFVQTIPTHRFLPYLSWQEIAQLEDKDNTVIILPTGAIEQHGPHLPCAVDSLICTAIVGAALEALDAAIPAYAIPTINYGKSNEHVHFPGTFSVDFSTLYHTLLGVAEGVYRSGFRKLLLVNSHGGQPQILQMVARELRIRYADFIVIFYGVWDVPWDKSEIAEEELRCSMHAGHDETALMLAIAPELVKMELAEKHLPEVFPCPTLSTGKPVLGWCSLDFGPSGVIGDPTQATLQHGQKIFAELTQSWVQAITEVYHMHWPARDSATAVGK